MCWRLWSLRMACISGRTCFLNFLMFCRGFMSYLRCVGSIEGMWRLVPLPDKRIISIRSYFISYISFQSVHLPENEKQISHRFNHLCGNLWLTLYIMLYMCGCYTSVTAKERVVWFCTNVCFLYGGMLNKMFLWNKSKQVITILHNKCYVCAIRR